MTGTSHGNVFDYFNTFSAVLDWWFSSKPECQKLSYLVSRVLDLKDTATLHLLIYFLTTDLVFYCILKLLLMLDFISPPEILNSVYLGHARARISTKEDLVIRAFQNCKNGPRTKFMVRVPWFGTLMMARGPNGWSADHGLAHS